MVRGALRPALPDRNERTDRPTRLSRPDDYPRLVLPWSRAFRAFYWVIRRLDPLVRSVSSRVQIGNVVELGVTGWRSGAAPGRFAGLEPHPIRAELLAQGDERSRVIGVTWQQHLFPGSRMYRLGRRHIVSVGRYYWVELI
jgi:hypothetical protein